MTTATASTTAVAGRCASAGRPLTAVARTEVERRLGRQYHELTGHTAWLHEDDVAAAVCSRLGVSACASGQRIYLGDAVRELDELARIRVIAHEMAHLMQIARGGDGGPADAVDALEREAESFSTRAAPDLLDVRGRADPGGVYGLWWLLPLAAGAYVLLRPNVANAPGPGDRLQPSVSEAQVAAEAFALFAIPGAGYSVAGRLGLGWAGRSAIAGALSTTSYRAVEDIFEGEFSGVAAYIFDAALGAVIGVITAGGILLIGQRVCVGMDWLATQGMRRADLAITQRLVERAASGPLSAAEAQQIFGQPGWQGRMAQRWLERRGMIVLYRGQGVATRQILSPIARENGVAASQGLEARMRAAGMTSEEIARYTAWFNNQPVPASLAPAGLGGQPLGGVGIPTTRIPGVAANFGEGAVVYTIRLPRGAAIQVPPWGLSLENEFVVLHQLPEGSIISTTPASRIPALTLDDMGRMVLPGN